MKTNTQGVSTRIPNTLRTLPALATLLAVLALSALEFAPRAYASEGASTAPAKEQPRKLPNHAKLLKQHLREKNGDAIKADLENIARTYPGITDKALRTSMLDAVGKAIRYRNDDIKSAALDAFEEMKDPAAWKHYRSFLKKPFKKSFPRLASQAMDVTRALAPEAAVSPLLTIMKKSKNLSAAAKALDTLGAFSKSRSRARILAEIISVTQKEKPGVRGRDNTVVYGPRQSGNETRNRWQAFARPMVEAANELTGQDLNSPDEWFAMWRENKRKPAELFQS